MNGRAGHAWSRTTRSRGAPPGPPTGGSSRGSSGARPTMSSVWASRPLVLGHVAAERAALATCPTNDTSAAPRLRQRPGARRPRDRVAGLRHRRRARCRRSRGVKTQKPSASSSGRERVPAHRLVGERAVHEDDRVGVRARSAGTPPTARAGAASASASTTIRKAARTHRASAYSGERARTLRSTASSIGSGQPAGERVLLAGVKAAEQRATRRRRRPPSWPKRGRGRGRGGRSAARRRSAASQANAPRQTTTRSVGERLELGRPSTAGTCRAPRASACWPAGRSARRR